MRRRRLVVQRRSIPAWAGETAVVEAECAPDQVYPRVGGGNPVCARFAPGAHGLSPRGRGKPEARQPLPTPPPEVYPRVGGGNYGS